MELNSALPSPKERPLKACINHCSDSRNFKEPIAHISTDPQLWNYSRILSLDASRLSSRIMARTRVPPNVGRFAFPARLRSRSPEPFKFHLANAAGRQAGKPYPLGALRRSSEAEATRLRREPLPLRSVSSTSAHPTGNARSMHSSTAVPLLCQQLPRCDRARPAGQDHDEQGGYKKQRHAQAGDHEGRHLCIQPLDSQGPEQTLE